MIFQKISLSCFLAVILSNTSCVANNYYQSAFGKPANDTTLKVMELFEQDLPHFLKNTAFQM
jgi:hypothetical protein